MATNTSHPPETPTETMNPLRWRYWFGQVDMRAMAVWRMLLGLMLLKEALYIWPLARIMYTDQGIMSREYAMQTWPNQISLLFALAHPWQVYLFFGLWLVIVVGFLVGWRTRTMTALNFIWMLSIVSRNPPATNGGDIAMLLFLFFGIFMPLGQYYALDAVLNRWRRFGRSHRLDDLRVEPVRTAYALPIRLMQVQIAIVYIFSGGHKLMDETWQAGNGLFRALQLQTYTHATGDWFFEVASQALLQWLSWGTILVEVTFVFWVFAPFLQPVLRLIGLAGVTSLHLGIAVLMSIRNFSIVMIMSYLAFIPGGWIAALDRRLRRQRRAVTVWLPPVSQPVYTLAALTHADDVAVQVVDYAVSGYDGWRVTMNTPPVNRETSTAFDVQAGKPHSISTLTSSPLPVGEGPGVRASINTDADTLPVNREASTAFDMPDSPTLQGLDAWRAVVAHMAFSRLWGWLVRFRWVRWLLWQMFAAAAYHHITPVQIASKPSSPTPTDALPARLYKIALALFGIPLMIGTFYFSLGAVFNTEDEKIIPAPPPIVIQFYDATFFSRPWNMFTPPTPIDAWPKLIATFEDGTEMDLYSGGAFDRTITRFFFGPNIRYNNLNYYIYRETPDDLMRGWAGYYCRLYNYDYALPEGQRLQQIDITYFYHYTFDPDFYVRKFINRELLWRHNCLPRN